MPDIPAPTSSPTDVPAATMLHEHVAKRRYWRWVLALGVVLLAVIGFLPTIIGSRWIYQPLIDRLAADNFRLTIDSVRLRWLSPLRLEGIQLNDPGRDGTSLVTVKQIQTDRGLLAYLIGGRRLGRLEIVQPTVAVELLQDGSNLQRVIQALNTSSSHEDKSDRQTPAVDIELIVRQLSAQVFRTEAQEPLVVVPPLDIEASYRAASGDSRLTIKPTKILNEVQITKELIDLGLGHAVPFLAKSAWFDGRVSLSVGDVDIPLASPVHSRAALSLTLHEVRSGPSHPAVNRMLDFVAMTRKVQPVHEIVFVDDSVIDLTVGDQRVHHSGLRFGLPKMDSRFQVATSGSVGIEDKSLELFIDIPVPVEQLARREEVQRLGVPTLQLPITGTLNDPKLNWEAMRGDAAQLLGVIRETLADDAPATASVVAAMEGLAEGKADESIAAAIDLIQQIRQRRQADKSTSGTQSDQPPAKKSQPVRDALRDLLKRK
ncbi:MAG: hypothetical protein IT423_15560 [Pirellulaceae bacterium]|nr:hypothetical protein [Pirellulaceae bacterium]